MQLLFIVHPSLSKWLLGNNRVHKATELRLVCLHANHGTPLSFTQRLLCLGIVLSALLACLILALEPRGRWYYSHCTSERMEAYTSRLLAFSPEASKWRHWDYCPGCLTTVPVLSPQALPNSGPSVLEYQKLWNFCKQTLSNFSLHQYWPPVWSLFHR